MFVKRDGCKVVIEIDSKLGTCKPIFPLDFYCGDDQEYAELVAQHLNTVIEDLFKKYTKDAYEFGWKQARAKEKKDLDYYNYPDSFE